MRKMLTVIAVLSLVFTFTETLSAKSAKPSIKDPIVGTISVKENLGEKDYYITEAKGIISQLPAKDISKFGIEALVGKKVTLEGEGSISKTRLKIKTIKSLKEGGEAAEKETPMKKPGKEDKKKNKEAQ